MMRLGTYAGISVAATLILVYQAFSSRRQFYPAMVYLSTSKISLVLLFNMGLVIMCGLWQLTKKVFLGSLREAEVERLNYESLREVMETLFAITIFRQDVSILFFAMVTALLLIKALHWLAQKRVEYIETTPTISKLSHVRIVSFLGFLLLVDSLLLYNFANYLLQTRKASVALFFSFEYVILAITTISTFLKYVFYVRDMLLDGQWERKAIYTFYMEIIRDLLHLSLYLCFFLVTFINYGVPLHLLRELYETFRNFRTRVADYIRYRKITSNMNDRFPDATPEEIDVGDNTCIICREEMTSAKKLICGHLFHVRCLRSWLERQNTCPTCRSPVVPPENGASTGRQHGVRQNPSQPGASSTSTTTEGSSIVGGTDSASGLQARRQAAAAHAASIYGKSFVYPAPNTIAWVPGYAMLPQPGKPDSSTMDPERAQTSVDPQQFGIPSTATNLPFQQNSRCVFVPLQLPTDGLHSSESLAIDPTLSNSQLEAQMLRQIEVLQNQLQLLDADKSPTESSDKKGKAVAS